MSKMDPGQNPYAAPPLVASADLPPQIEKQTGIWRSGKLLVMHKGSYLPDICVKSNEPATRRLQRKLTWHHPMLTLSILVNLLLYLVLVLVFQEKAIVYVPMTEEWFRRRRRHMLAGWFFGLTGFGFLIGGILIVDVDSQLGVASLLGGLAVMIMAAIIGVSAVRMVHPKKMTKEYIWLKGVCAAYLDRLPECPMELR